MKKQTVKERIAVLALVMTVIIIGIGFVFFALRYKRSKKPDDEISKAIYEAVGSEKIYYYGKKYSESGEIVVYKYTVCDYEDEKLLINIVKAANTAIQEKGTKEKIHLVFQEEFVSGAYKMLVQLKNYYECDERYDQYEALQYLEIFGSELTCIEGGILYNKVTTYITLPNIKSLGVSPKIAKAAEEEGIDWYEIWPDLEYYEVLED